MHRRPSVCARPNHVPAHHLQKQALLNWRCTPGAGCSCDTEFLRNSQLSDARFWCTEMAIYNIYDGDHHSILHVFDILYSIPLYCTSCKPCRIYTCANRVVIPRSKKTGFSRTHPVRLLKNVSSQPIKHSSIHSAFNLAPISLYTDFVQPPHTLCQGRRKDFLPPQFVHHS